MRKLQFDAGKKKDVVIFFLIERNYAESSKGINAALTLRSGTVFHTSSNKKDTYLFTLNSRLWNCIRNIRFIELHYTYLICTNFYGFKSLLTRFFKVANERKELIKLPTRITINDEFFFFRLYKILFIS